MDRLLKRFVDSRGEVPSFVWLQHAEASKEALAPSLMSVHLNEVGALHWIHSCVVMRCALPCVVGFLAKGAHRHVAAPRIPPSRQDALEAAIANVKSAGGIVMVKSKVGTLSE